MELISETGWEQVPGKQFTFEKSIKGKDDVDRDITVDFLTLQNNVTAGLSSHYKAILAHGQGK